METLALRSPPGGTAARTRILQKLVAADGLENFLATRFIGKKRFGLEGGESLLVVLDAVLSGAVRAGAEECVLGMAHRGRVNVLHNVAGKPAEMIFTEFEEAWSPHFEHGGGDVKYHQGFSGAYKTADGGSVRVSLCPNPSHLSLLDQLLPDELARGKSGLARLLMALPRCYQFFSMEMRRCLVRA